jgi:hypothetical protein
MLVVMIHSLLILGLIFLIGLMIGHIFGVMINRAFDKIPAQSALKEETLYEFQTEFKPALKEPEPKFTPKHSEPEQLDLALIDKKSPNPVLANKPLPETKPKSAYDDEIHYPVWAFGVITETYNQNRFSHSSRLSPLALLNRTDLEEALRTVQRPVEPVRFETPPRGHRDDLTRLRGLELKHQEALNRLGIYHLWQIASWEAAQTVWIAARIDFPELILLHHWIEKAAIELGCLRDESPSETLSWLKLDTLTPA